MPETGPPGPSGPAAPEPSSRPAAKPEARWPAWPTLLLPFLLVFLYMYRAAKEGVNWKAAFATVALFEAVLFPAEAFSVSRGHWVYNEARIWGPKVLGVPIEEPLLYYLFSPLIMITLMAAVRMRVEKAGRP